MSIRVNRSTAESLYLSMCQAQAMQAEAAKEDFAQHFWAMIGTANQLAYMYIEDAVESMKEAGMYIQKEKWHAQKAIEEYQKYERAAYNHFMETDGERYALWQDVIGRASAKLEPDVIKLHFAIKNVIDKSGVKNSKTLADIQTALALISLAVMMYDTMEEQCQRKTLVNIRNSFRGGRLSAVENHWKMVGEITGRKVMRNVNLRDDPQCRLGMEVILMRYQQADFLNESRREALELNPEVMQKYENGEYTNK